MARFTALLVVAAAAGISANPVKKAPKTTTVPLKLVNHVKAGNRFAEASSGPAINSVVQYTAEVTVGSDTFNLVIDTGSSNTWVAAHGGYDSSSGQDTGNTVTVNYGSGTFSGEEYTDSVSLAGLTVSDQSIGVASSASGFDGVDGIIGFGPVDLTQDTVSNTDTVPTFLNNLASSGLIDEEILGVYFAPESGSDDDDSNGELTFGGADSSKYTGSIGYVDLVTSGLAAPYWGIKTGAIKYGSTTLTSSTSGIVDTGTTLIYIPTSAYNKFTSASGGSTDDNTGLAIFDDAPTENLTFKLGSVTYTLTPTEYLIPADQYANWNITDSSKYYAYLGDGGDGSQSPPFTLGQKFLESFYSVYDAPNARVGFATRA